MFKGSSKAFLRTAATAKHSSQLQQLCCGSKLLPDCRVRTKQGRQYLCDVIQVDEDGDMPLESIVTGQLLWKRVLREGSYIVFG